MTVTIATVTNGQLHIRLRADERAIMRALGGVAGWVTERPHQGGQHSLQTCTQCRLSAAIRAVRATRGEDGCQGLATEDREARAAQMLAYLSDPDVDVTAVRMWLRWVHTARHLPMRHLGAYLYAMRVQTANYRRLAEAGAGANTAMLARASAHAADIAWSRIEVNA